MNRKLKCFISILLSFIMIIGLTTAVSAAEPRFSDTHSASVQIKFESTTAGCSVKIYGADGTTSIENVNITLKDSNGNVKAEWKNLSSTGKNFSFTDTVPDLTKGVIYTLAFSAKVKRNGNTEPISGSSSQTCPSK